MPEGHNSVLRFTSKRRIHSTQYQYRLQSSIRKSLDDIFKVVGIMSTRLFLNCFAFSMVLVYGCFSPVDQAIPQPRPVVETTRTATLVSPDGTLAVSVVSNSQPGYGTIFIRDVKTGKQLFSFEFHAVVEQQVIFSPDSMSLYFREVGDLLRWDRTTNTYYLIDGTFWVDTITVSPDGRYVAVLGIDELNSSPDFPNFHLTLIDLQLAAIIYGPIPEGMVGYRDVKFSDDSAELSATVCLGYIGDEMCNYLLSVDISV